MTDTRTQSPERRARDKRLDSLSEDPGNGGWYYGNNDSDSDDIGSDVAGLRRDLAAAEARAVKAEDDLDKTASLASSWVEATRKESIVRLAAEVRADDLQRRLDAVEARIAGVHAYLIEFIPRCYLDIGGNARRTAFQEVLALLHPQQEAKP